MQVTQTQPKPLATCPCGLPRSYAHCCARFHSRASALHLQAPTAEALMRSRYSAYVLDELDYLLATWHPSTRPAQLSPNEPGLKWLGLNVKTSGLQDAEHATVSFVARSRLQGRATRIAETSRFVREGGHWFYVDGELA